MRRREKVKMIKFERKKEGREIDVSGKVEGKGSEKVM